MQRYGDFGLIPRKKPDSCRSCCDKRMRLRQIGDDIGEKCRNSVKPRNKKVGKKLASYKISSYLCSVNGYLLTIRVSFPREGKALSILPTLKELLRQLFLFYVFCYE